MLRHYNWPQDSSHELPWNDGSGVTEEPANFPPPATKFAHHVLVSFDSRSECLEMIVSTNKKNSGSVCTAKNFEPLALSRFK